jgi:hypothetical protein
MKLERKHFELYMLMHHPTAGTTQRIADKPLDDSLARSLDHKKTEETLGLAEKRVPQDLIAVGHQDDESDIDDTHDFHSRVSKGSDCRPLQSKVTCSIQLVCNLLI